MTAPAPLTPADCDLQDFPFMPLHVARLRDSDLAATAHPEACWYAVLLWSASWHQIPAASLPDDELVLTRLCGLGRDLKTFRKHRGDAMRGFVKCSDGRLYHDVVAEVANASWAEKLAYRERKLTRVEAAKAAAEARWAGQRSQSELPLDASKGDAKAMRNASASDAERMPDDAQRMPDAMPKGRGRGIVKKEEDSTQPTIPSISASAEPFDRLCQAIGFAPSARKRDAEQARLAGWLDGWDGVDLDRDVIEPCRAYLADHPGATVTLERFAKVVLDRKARAAPARSAPVRQRHPTEGNAERDIRARVERSITAASAAAWLDPATLRLNGEALHVAVPTAVAADWIASNLRYPLEAAAEAVSGRPMAVEITVAKAVG